MEFNIISATSPDEHGLFYLQNGAEGCIGYLRGDFDGGRQFYYTWFDHHAELNIASFKREFDDVVNYLRKKPLQGFKEMGDYCRLYPDSRIPGWHNDIFGFKILTEHYSYYLRCFPHLGDYNFYILCYDNRYPYVKNVI